MANRRGESGFQDEKGPSMASLLHFLVVALEWSGESQEEHYFAMRLPRRQFQHALFLWTKVCGCFHRRCGRRTRGRRRGDRRGVGETTVHGMSSFPKDKEEILPDDLSIFRLCNALSSRSSDALRPKRFERTDGRLAGRSDGRPSSIIINIEKYLRTSSPHPSPLRR